MQEALYYTLKKPSGLFWQVDVLEPGKTIINSFKDGGNVSRALTKMEMIAALKAAYHGMQHIHVSASLLKRILTERQPEIPTGQLTKVETPVACEMHMQVEQEQRCTGHAHWQLVDMPCCDECVLDMADRFPDDRNWIAPALLDIAQRALARLNGAPTVCLCGSTRFSKAFHEANLRETIAEKRVLSIGCDFRSDTDLQIAGELTTEDKECLDALHFRKIDLAHEILVLNVDGYIGESTQREIAYAREQGKRVRYLEADHPSRQPRIGALVRMLTGSHTGQQGTIYDYQSDRSAPWHVRPEGWPAEMAGIAYKPDEIEVISSDYTSVLEICGVSADRIE